ncbi:unnamed protein product, partial [Urochloa humidicola]
HLRSTTPPARPLSSFPHSLFPPPTTSARRHPPAVVRLARAAAWPARDSTVAELGQRGPRRWRSWGQGRGGGGTPSGARLGLSRTRAADQRCGGGVAVAAPSSSLPKLVVLVGRILLVFLAVVGQQRRPTRSCCGGISGGWRPQLPLWGWIERGRVRCSPGCATVHLHRRDPPELSSSLRRLHRIPL